MKDALGMSEDEISKVRLKVYFEMFCLLEYTDKCEQFVADVRGME